MNRDTEQALERLADCLDASDVNNCLEAWKADRAKARQLAQAVTKAWQEQQRYYGIDEIEVHKDGSQALVAQYRIKPGDMKQFAHGRKLDEQRLTDLARGVSERYDVPGRYYRQSPFAHYMIGEPFRKAVNV